MFDEVPINVQLRLGRPFAPLLRTNTDKKWRWEILKGERLWGGIEKRG